MLSKKFNSALDSVKELTLRGHFTDAHKALDKLLKKDPTSKDLLNTKANIYIYQGFFNESLKLLLKCINLYPNNSDTLYNIGVVYHNIGQQNLAIENFELCIKNNPENIDAYINLTRVYIQTYSAISALNTINLAIYKNSYLEVCYHLQAQCYRLINDFENQKKSIELALKINPNNANNHIYLAFIYLWQNKTKEAKECLKEAFKQNPKNTFAIYNLMEIDKNSEFYSHEELLLNIREKYHLSNFDLIYYNLCLSKLYENQDDEKFILHLSNANKLKKQTINFNLDDYFKKYTRIFDKYHGLNTTNTCFDEYNPIFIVGLPRSGSSLVEQILINSPYVKTCGEVDILNYEFSENLDSLNQNTLDHIADKYINHIKLITDSKKFIDKLPLNFIWIGIIKLIFPKAKFIYTSRNKFDNCFSIFKTFFGDSALPFSYNANDIESFYNFHISIIDSWFKLLNKDKDIHKLDYEKLVANPKYEVKKLFDFLGLDFKESYLNLNNSGIFIQTASFSQARNEIKFIKNYHKYHKYFPEFS